MCDMTRSYVTCLIDTRTIPRSNDMTQTFFDGYCSTVQGLLNWFEVDLGFTELSFIQIDLCVLCVFVLYSSFSSRNCVMTFSSSLTCETGFVSRSVSTASNSVAYIYIHTYI